MSHLVSLAEENGLDEFLYLFEVPKPTCLDFSQGQGAELYGPICSCASATISTAAT